ncbi:hypothetical protein EGR_09240 [Echinococcus granulosus]|uniref:Uncharacterized protein n=1 Tax=Echinococcus granulosus TaxID=6210 RepID=W6U449_ECHGR|nr:hypothetical protein EGR_09240 [Echinococcus granulosus]EUB55883.1 hypothetical protein EGR_09240 [Echinococcus granulosus]
MNLKVTHKIENHFVKCDCIKCELTIFDNPIAPPLLLKMVGKRHSDGYIEANCFNRMIALRT